MKKGLIIILVLMLLLSNRLYSQIDTVDIKTNDTVSAKFPLKKIIIPAALISYGIASRISNPVRRLDYKIAGEVAKHNKYSTKIDDYMQYASHAAVFGIDLLGVKAKHKLLDRTFIVATSGVITALCVQTLKRTTLVRRPDGSDSYSFPSGHTATAFAGAHILFKEYKDESLLIGIAGYGMALTTGCMRMLNNKHWLSDIAAGAGIGMASVELSYLFLPAWNRLLGLKNKNKKLVIIPVISKTQTSFGLVYSF
ncbi:MAG: phosphatase PAP2 family protein [Prevotellaceae bacterium]|jgi:membrane-associated phospholipid phosphatase|nr:phosphatase PAP2 family protein [Prevotellaceae bacterium]